jgi:hypothetical protein
MMGLARNSMLGVEIFKTSSLQQVGVRGEDSRNRLRADDWQRSRESFLELNQLASNLHFAE